MSRYHNPISCSTKTDGLLLSCLVDRLWAPSFETFKRKDCCPNFTFYIISMFFDTWRAEESYRKIVNQGICTKWTHISHLLHLEQLSLYLEETMNKRTWITCHQYLPVTFSRQLFPLLPLFLYLINQDLSSIFILLCRILFFLLFHKVYPLLLCLLLLLLEILPLI